ncbi:MAG: hypothetical protein JWO44_1626 [Bacteroidetes bacterium]|nr:hypothetical protein [Bacteroidota bacterium]
MKIRLLKTYLFLSVIIGLLFIEKSLAQSNLSQSRYERFRTGKFIYPEINNGSYSIRNEKQQISYYPDGLTNTFEIKWQNDSVFILVFIESNKLDNIYKKNDEIIVKIDSAQDNCYSFSAFFKGEIYPEIKMCKVENKE